MKQKGMTLTSVLVAVALTSALAVAASKLVSNQAKLDKVMQLTDQRDMITRFYSALMHNRVVWRCTVYDTDNDSLRSCISDTSTCSSPVKLRTPDCKFKESYSAADGMTGIEELKELTAAHGTGDHYRSKGVFFDSGDTITLGNSITEPDPAGWWEVKLTATGVAKGSVDLTLTINFKEDEYKAAHADFDPPDIRDNVEYKVRKGDPNVEGIEEDCDNKAIVSIDDLASGIRGVTCSTDPLVDVQNPNARPIHKGNFFHSLADGADARVGKGASGTDDRTGLKVDNVLPHAIEDIKKDGTYELTVVKGNAGVLAFAPLGNACGGDNKWVLAGVNRSLTKAGQEWTHHRGPKGAQGLPGPPGYYQGPKGDPAPACPSTPPSCP